MTSEAVNWETLNHDPVTRALAGTVVANVKQVEAFNEENMESDEDKLTPGQIDAELVKFAEGKEKTDDKDVLKSAQLFKKAQDAFKEAQKAARKVYKTNILKQEVSDEDTAGEDEIRNIRKTAYDTVALIAQMTKGVDGREDVHKWAMNFPIPQVLRDGVSTVGQVKPRGQITLGEGENKVVWDSFAVAAKALGTLFSTEDTTVTIPTNDFINAWVEAGSPMDADWVFRNTKLHVQTKPSNK